MLISIAPPKAVDRQYLPVSAGICKFAANLVDFSQFLLILGYSGKFQVDCSQFRMISIHFYSISGYF
jgi:hypothetical protein